MQDFCPVCSKNGVKVKVKAFQLNNQEAVFMCSTENCIWPAGEQDLLFIDRPVGKEWSKNWDESSIKFLKTEQSNDSLLEFLPYTPPQTPGTETSCKDVAVIDKNPNAFTSYVEDIDNFTILSNATPKLISSRPVIKKYEKVFTSVNIRDGEQMTKVKKESPPTSIVNNSIVNKDKKLESSLIKKKPIQIGSKLFNKLKSKACPYEKFSFEALKREKSTKLADNTIKKETVKVEESNDCIKVLTDVSSSIKSDAPETIKMESTNVINACYLDVNETERNESPIDFDTILALTTCSKDSGVENSELDINLDDLLAGFSNEMPYPLRTEGSDGDDCKWIDSLFHA